MWAAIGAVVIGVLVPTLSGGSLPRPVMLIVLGVVLAGIAVTAYATLRRNGSTRRGTKSVASRLDRRSASKDREVVVQLRRLIREREFDWLCTTTFEGSWRDEHSARLRDVQLSESGDHRFSDSALQRAVARLINAAGTFLRVQDTLTIADPLIRDSDWRTIGRIGPGGEIDALSESERRAAQSQLRDAAAEVCQSYDALSAISDKAFTPDRPSRRPSA
jgi:hypothetical protein